MSTTATPETITETYTIPAGNLEQLQDEISRLNTRARRIGCTEIRIDVEPSHVTHEIQRGSERKEVAEKLLPNFSDWKQTGRVREYLAVTITGEAPRFAGWHLVAVLEPLETEDGAENIVLAVPGESCPDEYRERVGQCDHCGYERRRNQTFVCRHEDGSHKLVGRNCLADFLGHTDPHRLAKMAELLAQCVALCEAAADELSYAEGRRPDAWNLQRFAEVATASIVVDGWLSRGKARDYGGSATADRTIDILNPKPAQYRSKRDQEYLDTMEAKADEERQKNTARDAIQWAKELDDSETEGSDYLHNLRLVCRAGYVTGKTAGIAASLITAHARAQEKETRQREFAKRAETSTHQGEIGERIWRRLTVERINYSESLYGTTAIHGMADANGNAYTWFASGELAGFDKGETAWILATVKKHDEYRGIRQTVISRATVCDPDEYQAWLAKQRKADLQRQVETLTGEQAARGSKAELAARIVEAEAAIHGGKLIAKD